MIDPHATCRPSTSQTITTRPPLPPGRSAAYRFGSTTWLSQGHQKCLAQSAWLNHKKTRYSSEDKTEYTRVTVEAAIPGFLDTRRRVGRGCFSASSHKAILSETASGTRLTDDLEASPPDLWESVLLGKMPVLPEEEANGHEGDRGRCDQDHSVNQSELSGGRRHGCLADDSGTRMPAPWRSQRVAQILT